MPRKWREVVSVTGVEQVPIGASKEPGFDHHVAEARALIEHPPTDPRNAAYVGVMIEAQVHATLAMADALDRVTVLLGYLDDRLGRMGGI